MRQVQIKKQSINGTWKKEVTVIVTKGRVTNVSTLHHL